MGKNNEMPISRHPEFTTYLSTGDMARLGLPIVAETLMTHFNERNPRGAGTPILPNVVTGIAHTGATDDKGTRPLSLRQYPAILRTLRESYCGEHCK